jgi:hypothetical protein
MRLETSLSNSAIYYEAKNTPASRVTEEVEQKIATVLAAMKLEPARDRRSISISNEMEAYIAKDTGRS